MIQELPNLQRITVSHYYRNDFHALREFLKHLIYEKSLTISFGYNSKSSVIISSNLKEVSPQELFRGKFSNQKYFYGREVDFF